MFRNLILLAFAGLLLAGCMTVTQGSLSLDRLSQRIWDGRQVGEVASLTPGDFPAGMTRADAEALLRRSGYAPVAGAAKGQKPDSDGAEHWQRAFGEAGDRTIYDIYAHYDGNDLIAHVEGTMTQSQARIF